MNSANICVFKVYILYRSDIVYILYIYMIILVIGGNSWKLACESVAQYIFNILWQFDGKQNI